MTKRIVSRVNTTTRCIHGRLKNSCGFCSREKEILRLRETLGYIIHDAKSLHEAKDHALKVLGKNEL